MDTNEITNDQEPRPGTDPRLGTGQRGNDSPAFLRRHAVGLAVTAGVLAVIVVAGGTAWGVSAAVSAAQTTASAPAQVKNASHVSAKHGATHAKHRRHGAVGTISAMNGDTWTLHAASGATVTVKLSSHTAFGTKKAPVAKSSFTDGDRVGVLGTRAGDTVTASRIVHVPVRAKTTTGAPTPAPTT